VPIPATERNPVNANTARKIDDAIAQAVRCGESIPGIRAQVKQALIRALNAEIALLDNTTEGS